MDYVLRTLELFLYALEILLLVRVLSSWIPSARNHPIVQFIVQITDPLLTPIRKLINKSIFGGKGSMLDFSPLVAFLLLNVLQNLINQVALSL
ncbi:YggT family protein [Vallitalea pronyensis]|uniref:YggT family protein n=1 Tax=Vallitalea pronyensis TaxID=1348613 RepID=A0A8J8MKT2_9FIRM|nr:YggT family protein [Vallitalea pronyensis]QUI23364.1 YggT family protein [Vallitalea pronyensis]